MNNLPRQKSDVGQRLWHLAMRWKWSYTAWASRVSIKAIKFLTFRKGTTMEVRPVLMAFHVGLILKRYIMGLCVVIMSFCYFVMLFVTEIELLNNWCQILA